MGRRHQDTKHFSLKGKAPRILLISPNLWCPMSPQAPHQSTKHFVLKGQEPTQSVYKCKPTFRIDVEALQHINNAPLPRQLENCRGSAKRGRAPPKTKTSETEPPRTQTKANATTQNGGKPKPANTNKHTQKEPDKQTNEQTDKQTTNKIS